MAKKLKNALGNIGIVLALLVGLAVWTQLPAAAVLALAVALAALLAAIVGLPPALKAKRLDIVNALSNH